MLCHVLVIDDDPGFLALAVRILRGLGLTAVATAGDAATAIARAVATRPDAMLVDVGLPDADGIDLAYRLAALPWHPCVVVTSSDRDAVRAIEARHGGSRPLPFVVKEDVTGDLLRQFAKQRGASR